MKKVIAFTLTVLLLFSLAAPAFAVSGTVSLNASSVSLKRGDTFTITASLSAEQSLSLGTVKLDYNSDAFTLTGGTCHITGTSLGLVIPEKNAGTFLFEDDPRTVSGALFTFTFTVKEDAPFGGFTISSSASMGTDSAQPLVSDRITVTVVGPGDVNGNNGVDNDDVLYLLWHTVFEEDYALYTDGDVNRDGSIDHGDVIYLLWHLLFGNTYPL